MAYPFHKRGEWASIRPQFGQLRLPVRKVFAHHTAGAYMPSFDVAAMRDLEQSEIARGGYVALAYHTLFLGDGDAVESRPVTAMGGATLNQNSVSIAICLPGNYALPGSIVSLAQNESAIEWLLACVVYGVITRDFSLLPHDAVYATECPGVFQNNLAGIEAEVKRRAAGASPVPQPPQPPPAPQPNVFLSHLSTAVAETRWFEALGYYVIEGSHNDAVWTVQLRCLSDGDNPGAIDSDFGPKTLAAVETFQGKHGLKADGIVGPRTYGAMYPN